MKNFLIGALCLGALGFAYFHFNSSTAQGGYTTVTVHEIKKKIDEGKSTLIDVREPSEYKEGHIPGAILIPLGTIKEKAPSMLPDKTKPLLVYCRSGARSARASQELVDMGYQEVYNMEGGFMAWPYEKEK